MLERLDQRGSRYDFLIFYDRDLLQLRFLPAASCLNIVFQTVMTCQIFINAGSHNTNRSINQLSAFLSALSISRPRLKSKSMRCVVLMLRCTIIFSTILYFQVCGKTSRGLGPL